MLKDDKSKKKKMAKLRQILDNPNDPKFNKSKSKEDENLELVRKRLLDESSQTKDYVPSSESSVKKTDSLEPISTVHENKKEVEPEIKQSAEDISTTKDLIEIEKAEVSKPESSQDKPKEVVKKTKPEKTIDEIHTSIDKKDKIIDFQEAEKDEIYRMAKRGIPSSDKIQIYKPITIIEIWAFTIIIGIVAISGLFLMRDWLFLNFGVYGDKFITTPVGTLNVHIWFGFAFAVIGLFHLAIHIFSRNKDILPKKTLRDFKAFLHSGIYLIGFARREDYQTSERYSGRQRITYFALVYILSLTAITGFLYYMNLLSQELALVHVIPAGLSIMVLLFHFLITIRNHDMIALKCAFIDGKIPRWYARKNSPIWLKIINKERESTIKKLLHSKTFQTNNNLIDDENNLDNALLKFALLINENPDVEDLKAIAKELQVTMTSDDLKRIIELAKKLKDEPEEESKQETKDENQKSEEESK